MIKRVGNVADPFFDAQTGSKKPAQVRLIRFSCLYFHDYAIYEHKFDDNPLLFVLK
jgi:hypothetical protein